MSERAPISLTTLAHEAFAALTGILLLGAIRSRSMDAPLVDFVSAQRWVLSKAAQVEVIRTATGTIIGLPDPLPSTFTEKAWWMGEPFDFDPWLVLHSGALETFPIGRSASDVRRLADAGLDQLHVDFLDVLVRGSIEFRHGAQLQAGAVLDVIDQAVLLTDIRIDAAQIYRMWRLAILRPRLDPRSALDEAIRTELRVAAVTLEAELERRGLTP